ncbi:MAG: alpha/beta fold hydrolase [Mycobacterium sp.]
MSLNRVGVHTYRLAAALLVVLWSFATIWLATGIAHADDSASHDSPSSSSEPDKTDKADKPAAEKPADTPKTSEDKTETSKKADKPRKAHKHATTKPAAKEDSTTAAKADPKPDPAQDTKPVTKKKQGATAKAASIDTATAGTATTAASAAALKLASPAVTPSASAKKAPNPIAHAIQFARQMTGLANDIGLLAVTLVNNLAAVTATAIGPKPFFGVPYHFAAAIAGTAATAGKLLSGTPLNADLGNTGPYKVTYGVGNLLDYLNVNKSPAGANISDTIINADHPLPVILIAGTAANAPFNWSVGAPVLANAGYTVFTFNYGNVTKNPIWPVRGTADIRKSAAELAAEVERVKTLTGSDKVILIGHSQGGGLTPEYYLNNLGGAASVAQFIGIAPGHHGADVDGLAYIKNIPLIGKPILSLVNLLGPAWLQQAIGSPLLDEIYGKGDTRPGVSYTTISTKNDWIVTPYTNQALNGGDPGQVTNIVLQDLYPNFNAGHLGLVFAKPTWDVVLKALSDYAAANPANDETLTAA